MNNQERSKRTRLIDKFLEEKREFVYTYRFEIVGNQDDEAEKAIAAKSVITYVVADPESDSFFYTVPTHYLLTTANTVLNTSKPVFSVMIWSLEPLEEERILFVKMMLGKKLLHYNCTLVKNFERDANGDWRIQRVTKN